MILVLRALGVGDLATAVPALRGIRAAYPRERLALAAPGWLKPLVALTGVVDKHLPVDGIGRTRLPRAKVAVNLHGRGPQSHHMLAAAKPGRLLAFACDGVDGPGRAGAGFDGPEWTFEEHEVARWCRMLSWHGIATDPNDLDLVVPSADHISIGLTIVHPGAKSGRRRWPPERFGVVARELSRAGHHVVVTGSADERPIAAAVARAARLPADRIHAGRTGLADLAAMVAHARLVICGDTGVAHLATAYRTPSVVLFGPMPPRLWGPPADRPYHRAIWHGKRAEPGDAPGSKPHPGLLRITPDEVLATVTERSIVRP
jgi:ADP-heptose:LPS heptosyltransferase